MLRNGPSVFPTTYGQPYADYSAVSTLFIWLLSLPFGHVNSLSAWLPSALKHASERRPVRVSPGTAVPAAAAAKMRPVAENTISGAMPANTNPIAAHTTDAELPTAETIRVKLNALGYALTRVAKTQPQKRSPRPTPSSSR